MVSLIVSGGQLSVVAQRNEVQQASAAQDLLVESSHCFFSNLSKRIRKKEPCSLTKICGVNLKCCK